MITWWELWSCLGSQQSSRSTIWLQAAWFCIESRVLHFFNFFTLNIFREKFWKLEGNVCYNLYHNIEFQNWYVFPKLKETWACHIQKHNTHTLYCISVYFVSICYCMCDKTNINPKHLLVTYWYYKNCILTICFFKYQKRIGLSHSISKF